MTTWLGSRSLLRFPRSTNSLSKFKHQFLREHREDRELSRAMSIAHVLIEIEGQGTVEAELYKAKAPVTVQNFLHYVDAGQYEGGRFYRTVREDNQAEGSVLINVIQGGVDPDRVIDEGEGKLSPLAERRFFHPPPASSQSSESAPPAHPRFIATTNNCLPRHNAEESEEGGLKRFKKAPPVTLEKTNATGLLHKDGSLSMARSTPDSATTEFFVCIGDQPELDFGGKRNPDGQGFAAFGKVV